MKTLALVTFSLLSLSQISFAHAGHEISHVAAKHSADPAAAEVDPQIAAETEEDPAHRHPGYGRRYGWRPYYSPAQASASEELTGPAPESEE